VEPSLGEEDADSSSKIEPLETPSSTADSRIFPDLPDEDELTEFEEPPLVLGLEPDPPPMQEDASLHGSDLDLTAIEDETFNFTTPLEDDPVTEPEYPMDVQGDPDVEDDPSDPFSFIDLIPPDRSPPQPSPDPTPSSGMHDPPPIRTKPLMPLPTPEAVGAPTHSTTTPSNSARIPEERVLSSHDRTSPEEMRWERALSTAGLSQPREIAPRILDPERARLEVDVYADDEHDDIIESIEGEVPLLTQTSVMATPANPTPVTAVHEESVFDLITAGLNALNRGEIKTATDLLSDALDWEPQNVEARLSRGQCLRDRGDSAGAMSDFLKAEQAAPHSCEPQVEIGNLFFSKKDYGRAIVHYTEALSIHPGHAMAMCRRGISFYHRRQPNQALDDLKAAKAIDASIPNIDRYITMVTRRNRAPSPR
jgi:Tfp pilus assembly protein PilF